MDEFESETNYWTEAEKQRFLSAMIKVAHENGYKENWIRDRYRETFREEPPPITQAA